MFTAARASALVQVEWDAKRVEYIEAWNFDEGTNGPPLEDEHRDGVLHKDSVEEWLHHRGQFAIPEVVSKNKDRFNGGLRLLICDRTSLFPPGFGMSKSSFEEAEKVLHLHKATLPSFLVANGTHSRYLTKDPVTGKLQRIAIVLKAPQKYEIANYGLSVSFDVETSWTTALLYGESVTRTSWTAMNRHMSRKLEHREAWEYQSPAQKVLELLKSASLPWNHPLLLPCSLMADHLHRMRAFCEGELTRDVMAVERELGVVRVGNRSEHGMSGLWPHFRLPAEEADWTNALLDRPTVMNSLTTRINVQYTKIIFTKRSPSWSLETSDFLLGVWGTSLKSMYTTHTVDGFLTESLEYNKDIATSIQNHVDNLQTRMGLQLEILYSFLAQKDNRLNTRIARSSGRDSVSMKILAFISAIFLPPSYIATLFAMQGLFNWEPGSGGADGPAPPVVSKKFWIYWVVAVPLTALTLVGWAIWWRIEVKRYPDDPDDKSNLPPGFVASIMETMGWKPSDVAPAAKVHHDHFVFGGRRRASKLGVDGNPSLMSVVDAEAGAFASPKSPVHAGSRPFP